MDAIGEDAFYTTRDEGRHWQSHTAGLEGAFGFLELLADPSQPSTLYVSSLGGGVIHESLDGGRTWRQAANGLDAAVFGLAIDRERPRRLYAATPLGVSVSTDGAGTWSPTSLREVFTSRVAADPADPAILYAGTFGSSTQPGQVFRSRDRGRTWTEVLTLPENWLVLAITIDPRRPGQVYLGLQSALTGYVGTTSDGGRTWDTFPMPGGPVSAVVPDPSRPGVLYAGATLVGLESTGGMFVSLDGGRTWTDMSQGLTWADVNDLAVDRTGCHLWAATVRGGASEFERR